MRKNFCVLIAIITVFICIFCFQSGTIAQTNDYRISLLEKRIDELEKRVERLEQLIISLQEKPKKDSKNDTSSLRMGDWKIRKNWSNIKNGMSIDQVTKFLGKPTSTDRITERMFTLYYEGFVEEAGAKVSGNIFFISNTVSSISPPVY